MVSDFPITWSPSIDEMVTFFEKDAIFMGVGMFRFGEGEKLDGEDADVEFRRGTFYRGGSRFHLNNKK